MTADEVILDATVVLPSPQFDGDHRASSGYDDWLAAHIPGSVHADLLHDLSDPAASYHFARPSATVLAERLGQLGVDDRTPVAVYDNGGGIWAARLWWLLRWIGVDARILEGGLDAWVANGGAVAHGPATPRVGSVTPRVREGLWVEKDDLRRWLAGEAEATVVCALSPAAFQGEVPTRYARRGHIPGSVNVPARGLESAGELAGPVWAYCGGGISAAGLAYALVRDGREDVAIYDGSLEEWSADPELPLSTDRLPPPVRELLDRPEFGVLTTLDPDGTAHSTVMWVGREGDELVLASKDGRRQVRNLRRDSRATVLVYDRAKPTRYAEIQGAASVHDEGGRELVDRLARRYVGADHEVGTEAEENGRVLIRIVPERVLHRT
ncbi:TIGR03618 family F420-dependent PPOX class oxidoreductase [Paractinoplanes lichenicola]|uniref:TIGR03618 family F420-dependent PPOX class oxidoreductase n=1 Tax=Paractinoplanes lichenicola TaxID=2802976 RepID=A0ABS1VEM8_9ACTN|nr:TIGR03618 family F420-dependent PPOX class oxidoreductase [Actinoplanes lichenicola]MBL7253148.1 TIGR03618 family F420-dependent PPOX class oxidoreductase [Actinoplanes lichenicola]